jgi:formate/nitrite transporter FocA (FNT family)
MKENFFNIFIRSILAGICIGLGGAIFIKLGGVIGACMFAFGLLTVVHFKLPLYTGTAGFIEFNKASEYEKMLLILFGNILGCILLSYLNIKGVDGSSIIQSRIDAGYLQSFLNAIGCGLIMTLIVQGGRDKNWLLILFGIPVFILLGFYHSIADAFYMMVTPESLRNNYFLTYWIIVGGNFVGCNIPRILLYKKI